MRILSFLGAAGLNLAAAVAKDERQAATEGHAAIELEGNVGLRVYATWGKCIVGRMTTEEGNADIVSVVMDAVVVDVAGSFDANAASV